MSEEIVPSEQITSKTAPVRLKDESFITAFIDPLQEPRISQNVLTSSESSFMDAFINPPFPEALQQEAPPPPSIALSHEMRTINDKMFLVLKIGEEEMYIPEEYLNQHPMTTHELVDAAEWFVYHRNPDGSYHIPPDVSGLKPEKKSHSPLFERLLQISNPNPSFAVKLLSSSFRAMQQLEKVKSFDSQDIHVPFYRSRALVKLAELTYGRELKDEYLKDGAKDFYKLIAPVYELFHQFNTQAVPDLQPKEIDLINEGPIPFTKIKKSVFTKEREHIPNDMIGRQRLAEEIATILATKPNNPDKPLRILGVGEGPALTTIKVLENVLAKPSVENIEVIILEYEGGQIDNGKRAFEQWKTKNPDLAKQLQTRKISMNWIQGSAGQMGLPDNACDIVYSSYVVGAIGGKVDDGKNLVEAFGEEALRVLNKGGQHIIMDFDRPDLKGGYEITAELPLPEKIARLITQNERVSALFRPTLENVFSKIWDHKPERIDQAIEATRQYAIKHQIDISVKEQDRQTFFGHFPLPFFEKEGSSGIEELTCVSVPGFGEKTITITKN